MGILDNLENAWDDDFQFESKSLFIKDNVGREEFWNDAARPENDNLEIKLFSDSCCTDCSCKSDQNEEFFLEDLDLEK
jgi:hypothetical protein